MNKLAVSVRRRDIRPEDLILSQDYDVTLVDGKVPGQPIHAEIDAEVQFKIGADSYIELIKAIRFVTGWDLAESKRWVDRNCT